MNKIVMTPKMIQKAVELFNQNLSYPQIAKILGINTHTLQSYFWNIGIRRHNKGNVHYFDEINSYAKAYIVGFIAADGSLVKGKTTTTLTITIKYEDKALLEFIKSEIGNDHKLLEIRRPSSYNPSKNIHHIRWSMSDKNITKALNKLGIFPKKSLTIGNVIQNIPYKYRDAFIIGFFDGNGSVSIRDRLHKNQGGYYVKDYSLYISMRSTKEFLEGICEHLGITKSHIRTYDSIPSLSFANKKDVLKLYKCYEHLPFYYIRKYDKFLQRINHPSYDKYKQDQTISSPIE